MLTQLFALPARLPIALLATLIAAGCASPPQGTARPAPAGEAGQMEIPAGTQAFTIDPAQTRVTLLVYRTGPLARLGHNHAIVSGEERGVVWIGRTPAQSGFEIHVPVAALVVDDPDARAAAGAEFPGTVPDDARAGTTTNMRRAEVLDVDHYPEIVVRAESATGTWQQAVVHASVRLKDVQRELDVPVTLQVSGDVVTADGTFQVRQTDFGITPFSVAGGAIQVSDVVDVRFAITATREATR